MKAKSEKLLEPQARPHLTAPRGGPDIAAHTRIGSASLSCMNGCISSDDLIDRLEPLSTCICQAARMQQQLSQPGWSGEDTGISEFSVFRIRSRTLSSFSLAP
jgi:hypothetical protein